MDTNAPILPKLKKSCEEILALDINILNEFHLLTLSRIINIYCKLAQHEIFTGNKCDLARLLLEAAARLQPYISPDTAMLLDALVGKEGLEELLKPLQNEGWQMRKCDCKETDCPGYQIATIEFFEALSIKNHIFDQINSNLASIILKANSDLSKN